MGPKIGKIDSPVDLIETADLAKKRMTSEDLWSVDRIFTRALEMHSEPTYFLKQVPLK